MQVSLEHLTIRFRQGVEAVQDVSFSVQSGEFVAIVGPSGCGKSTTLNAIASLLGPEEAQVSGRILIDGKDLTRWSTQSLNLGYVFQRDNLLPWRTILGNVETGLEIRGVPPAERAARAMALIEMAGLVGFEHYYPYQVSGGMRQRTALIRTLAYDPDLVLMDEPFGALDAHTRLLLQAELLRVWERTRKTILFVTHDLGEAITLAQRVVLFTRRPGRVRQIYDVSLPYPRDPIELRGSSEFARIETTIWRTLREDFRADAATAGQGGA